MGVTLAAVGEYFAADAAAEVALDVGIDAATADATSAALLEAGATTEEASLAGSALGGSLDATAIGTVGETAAATGGSGAFGTLAGSVGKQALGSVASTAVGQLMTPKPKAPSVAAAIPMPDPLAQQAAQKKSLAEQMARRGRASTILTSPAAGGGKLGG